MAPVIRISDDAFQRLQALSEPLVDTPNSVISRLLDTVDPGRTDAPPRPPATRGEHDESSPDLFLAPASPENLAVSVKNEIRVDSLENRLDPDALGDVQRLLEGRATFKCWAMTKSSLGTFQSMKTGDLVLFSPKGTGLFTYRGTVLAKQENSALGKLLWPIQPGRPWSLIYFLDDVTPVKISKELLLAQLRYSPTYRVPGIIRVAPERLQEAVARNGGLEDTLKAASSS